MLSDIPFSQEQHLTNMKLQSDRISRPSISSDTPTYHFIGTKAVIHDRPQVNESTRYIHVTQDGWCAPESNQRGDFYV